MIFSIDGTEISRQHSPYIIAEMSANHNGDIENAYRIIDMAKRSGANAVKIQSYTPDTITLNSRKPDFMINEGLWAGQSLYQLYEQAHLPWAWHEPIFNYAKKVGITLFSSPFDFSAIDMLESLGAPAYKIASFEAIDLPLIRYAASTGKPLIISTGMADFDEISEAVDTALSAGCKQLALLHCVSGYPAQPSEYNLATLRDMQSQFNIEIGLSDHTVDNLTSILAVGMGASIVEKHVTLNREGGGPDDSFSLEENDLQALCDQSKQAWLALGKVDYGRKSSEVGNAVFRRSLYFVRNLSPGDQITPQDIRSVRPGFGLAPKYMDDLIGRKVSRAIEADTAVTWECFEQKL